MKHISAFAALLLACLTLLPVTAGGQAKINTKKLRIADFGARPTKVVLGGNDMTDSVLKEAVSAGWRISPFEFCTREEYLKLKNDPREYFLLLARSNEPKYRGIVTLTLMKGGKSGTGDTSDRPVDIASLPFRSSDFPSGREMVMLPALLDILQDYASKALLSDKAGYKGFKLYSKNLSKADGMKVIFSKEDIEPDLSDTFTLKYLTGDVCAVDEELADQAFLDSAPETLASYVVAPFGPEKGQSCYKMLIGTRTHQLYYFKRHRIGAGKWAGFLKKDIKKAALTR